MRKRRKKCLKMHVECTKRERRMSILLSDDEQQIVDRYLEKEDYLIRHRNWRKGHFELDIVAAKDNELVVVEVKTRSNTEFAQPEDAVDVPKIRRTVRAADTYIKLFQIDIPVRFDIITVVGENGNFEIEHIKEAFLPPLF